MSAPVILNSNTLENYIRNRIETGTAKLSTFIGSKKVYDEKRGYFTNVSVEIVTFPLETEVTYIDDFGIPFEYSEEDLGVIYDDTVNLMYIGNALYLTEAHKSLMETFRLVGERMGYDEHDLSELMSEMCKNYMVPYEMAEIDARVLHTVLEMERIEALFASVNNETRAYVYETDQRRVENFIKTIENKSVEEKEDYEKCAEEVLEEEEIYEDDPEISEKSIETKSKEYADMDFAARVAYFKGRAENVYAMSDEELVGLMGEMADALKYMIMDNSVIRDQIYEENIFELENAYAEVYQACQDRGIVLADFTPTDAGSRVFIPADAIEDKYNDKPSPYTETRRWREETENEITDYEERRLFF